MIKPMMLASALALSLPAGAALAQGSMPVQAISGTRLDIVATGEVTRVPDVARPARLLNRYEGDSSKKGACWSKSPPILPPARPIAISPYPTARAGMETDVVVNHLPRVYGDHRVWGGRRKRKLWLERGELFG